MVFKRLVEGEVNKVENAKIAVYSCPLDVTQTETKVLCAVLLYTLCTKHYYKYRDMHMFWDCLPLRTCRWFT